MKKNLFAITIALMPVVSLSANTINYENPINPKCSTNSQVDSFFNSDKFSNLSKNFNIQKGNFDLNDIEVIKIDDSSSMIRLKVHNKSRVDIITLMPNNSVVLYEKIFMNESGNGSIEQYAEDGTLVANFKVMKNTDGKFSVKLNFINNVASPLEDLKCIKDTYNVIKSTCDADTTCSISCDLSPQCATIMYGVAAAHCMASGNNPPKGLAPQPV